MVKKESAKVHTIADLLLWNRHEDLVNHETQEKKKHSGWKSCQNDESKGQICTEISHPNGEKRIPKQENLT